MKKIFFFLAYILPVLIINAQTGTNVITDRMPGSNCDATVHNLLPVDALNRTPSECEVQFYRRIMNGLQQAFGKLMRNWATDNMWQVTEDTAVKSLTEISKHAEQYFFRLPGFYLIDMKMNPASEPYKPWLGKYGSALEDMKINPGEESLKKFLDVSYDVHGATEIKVMTTVNGVSNQIHFFKGGKTFNVPGAAYAVKGRYAQALTGGDIADSKDACLILFGNPKMDDQRYPNGVQDVKSVNVYPKASKLTVQQIAIRIECNDELLNQVLKQIDFGALKDMIGK